MSEQIRSLTYEELHESIDLSSFAFQYEVKPEERAERIKLMAPDRVWGYFVDGQMAAKLVQLPFKVHMNGAVIPMGGIAGVATWPEYRRQGLVAKLLKHTLQLFREQGFTISYLHPFSFGFYRKYGWEACFDYKTYDIEMSKLKGTGASSGIMRGIAAPLEQWESFHEIYTRFAKSQFNGMLDRDEAWWKHYKLNKPGRYSIYYDDSGAAQGYIVYEVKNRVLTIREWVYLNEDARRALLHFVANHDSMAERVTFSVAADDELPFLLPDPKFTQQVVSYFMARIVDVPAFIEQLPFQGDGKAHRILLDIEDEHAEWNNGQFLVTIDQTGKASAIRVDDGAVSADAVKVSCSIQMLAVLLLGYRRPARLAALGKLHTDEEAVQLLQRLLPERQTYLPDFF